MAKRRQAARPQGIDLEPIINLMSRLGLGGSMSSPAGNPREAMGRSVNRSVGQDIVDTAKAVSEEGSAWVSPYSISELNRMRKGDVRPSDAVWGALYALPAAKPIRRARTAFRAGRSALKGVETNPTGTRATTGVAGEPSGEAQYATLNALFKLLGG